MGWRCVCERVPDTHAGVPCLPSGVARASPPRHSKQRPVQAARQQLPTSDRPPKPHPSPLRAGDAPPIVARHPHIPRPPPARRAAKGVAKGIAAAHAAAHATAKEGLEDVERIAAQSGGGSRRRHVRRPFLGTEQHQSRPPWNPPRSAATALAGHPAQRRNRPVLTSQTRRRGPRRPHPTALPRQIDRRSCACRHPTAPRKPPKCP